MPSSSDVVAVIDEDAAMCEALRTEETVRQRALDAGCVAFLSKLSSRPR